MAIYSQIHIIVEKLYCRRMFFVLNSKYNYLNSEVFYLGFQYNPKRLLVNTLIEIQTTAIT